jgi:RNA polymerase sigma-70 factor (ECF subfamily)
VVARLLTALWTTRPATVRQFFALANQYMRWQLNDLARRLESVGKDVPLKVKSRPS